MDSARFSRPERWSMALAAAALGGCSLLTDLGGYDRGEDDGALRTEGQDGGRGSGSIGPVGDGGTSPVGSSDAATPADAGGAPSATCTPSGTVETSTARPSSVVDDPRVGNVAWRGAANAAGADALSASATLDGTQITHWLLATDFGFALPDSVLVRGFTVRVRRRAGFPDEIADHGLALVREGTPVPTTRARSGTWATTFATVEYGGPTDGWNEAWTSADVRSRLFGVALAARGVPAYSEEAEVEHVEVTLHFERCVP